MDAFENLKKRAEELRAELNRHARLYYEARLQPKSSRISALKSTPL